MEAKALQVSNTDKGQSTLEFAVVAIIFVAISIGIWALAEYALEGSLVDSASQNAPYAVDSGLSGVPYALLF